METKLRRVCPHIPRGELAKHSTLTIRTVPPGENTTDYHYDVVAELCPFCSGRLYGQLSGFLAGLVDTEERP